MFLSAWVYLIFQRVKVNKRKELYRKITSNLYRLLYLTASITALKNSVIRNFQISARGPISFTFPAIPLISILITLFYGLTLEQFLIQILKSFQKLWFINHYLSQYFFLFFCLGRSSEKKIAINLIYLGEQNPVQVVVFIRM